MAACTSTLALGARTALVASRAIAAAAPVSAPMRTAVNLAALKMRIRATNNVAKITNVMKMVASSKLKGVEANLAKGRLFGESLLNAVALKDVMQETNKEDDAAMGIFLDDKKNLCVTVMTDRGLCGSVNSSLSRALRKEINEAIATKASLRLFVVGDKGRSQISRDYMPIVARTIDTYLEKDPIFPLASAIASRIIAEPYEVLTFFYNQYVNQIKFNTVYKKVPQLAGGALPASLKGYEVEPENSDETLTDLQEYAIASALYYTMLETVACETAQRVTAMDNASTNAKDMVDRFKLLYNRARQSKITTELIEIIAGAESLVVDSVSE